MDVLHSKPYQQEFDKTENACRGQTRQLILQDDETFLKHLQLPMLLNI